MPGAYPSPKGRRLPVVGKGILKESADFFEYSFAHDGEPSALWTWISTRHSALKSNVYPGGLNFACVQNIRTSPVSAIGVAFVVLGPSGTSVRSTTETPPAFSP